VQPAADIVKIATSKNLIMITEDWVEAVPRLIIIYTERPFLAAAGTQIFWQGLIIAAMECIKYGWRILSDLERPCLEHTNREGKIAL
jgi:hypothetical protein